VSLFELVVISISLAMDAFTVSMMYGNFYAKWETSRNKASLLFILAFFQALMPFFRVSSRMWFFQKDTSLWSLYCILSFLMIVGINMLKDAFNEEESQYNFQLLDLTILAFATSIDAFAIGMTFAFFRSIYLSSFIDYRNYYFSIMFACFTNWTLFKQ